MLDITSDIQSLTTFRRRSGDFMKQLKKSKRPAEEGIRQGLDDVAHGRTRPSREVFDEIRRQHDIPR
ncbi:MAG: hypothetical protein ABSE85_13065 [Candidatus Korobacteraceae bacterium]